MARDATLAGAVGALLVAIASVAAPAFAAFPGAGSASTVAWLAVSWVAFAVGAWLVCRLGKRTAVVLIVVGGLALGLAAGLAPPRSSDDVYRYIWDGRVSAAGIDPYRYAPADEHLAGLRDESLWPTDGAWCVNDPAPAGRLPGCTRINRPIVHTIYPPVAEALFLAVHVLSPPGPAYRSFQFLGVLCALATTVLLLFGLRHADPRRVVLWAWCPTIAVEAGSNAHIDIAAAFLAGAALLVLARAGNPVAGGRLLAGLLGGGSGGGGLGGGLGGRRSETENRTGTTPRANGFGLGVTRAIGPRVARRAGRVGAVLLGGALLGLAIAAKVTPVLLVPAVLRRRPVALITAMAGAIIMVYLPHLFAVGADVIGYIPGYLHEEGYADGSRFALLTWLLPERWAAAAAALILAAVALLVWRTADPDRAWPGAAVMVGAALLVTTPSYPWYAILLVLAVGGGGRAIWLTVAAAGYLAQYAYDLGLSPSVAQRIGYGLAAGAVVVDWLRRRRNRTALTPDAWILDTSASPTLSG